MGCADHRLWGGRERIQKKAHDVPIKIILSMIVQRVLALLLKLNFLVGNDTRRMLDITHLQSKDCFMAKHIQKKDKECYLSKIVVASALLHP